jgi:hypothetical protein
MITEDQLEQLAHSWFRDRVWGYAHGPKGEPTTETDLQQM